MQRKRSFLWGTPTNASTMLDAEHWVLDDTSKSAPDMFYQLFTFRDIFPDNWHLPQFNELLPGKTTLLYKNLFEELNIWGHYQPHSILMDCEIDYCLFYIISYVHNIYYLINLNLCFNNLINSDKSPVTCCLLRLHALHFQYKAALQFGNML